MFQGYRTFIAAGLVAMFSVLAAFDWGAFFSGDPKVTAWGLMSALIMAVLRVFTTTPPGVPSTPPNEPKA